MVITNFIVKRSLGSTLLWGFLFGITIISSAAGFITAFPTAKDQLQLVNGLGNNVGLKAVLGIPHAINTVGGFTEWRSLGVITIIGALWGMMLVTKLLRGDEEDGRWELILAGPTNKRRAILETFAGLTICLAIVFAFSMLFSTLANQVNGISFSLHERLYFALATVAVPALFMSVGALTSQIASSKRQALGLALGIFGIVYAMRAVSDSLSGYDWLHASTPLGWIENIQPLTNAQPMNFLWVGLVIAVTLGLTIFIASKRDLGAGIIPEAKAGRAKLLLLRNPWTLGLRLAGSGIITWTVISAVAAAAFVGVAQSAAESLRGSTTVDRALGNITNTSNTAALFLGLFFLILILMIMGMTASMANGIREEEAAGHTDTLLVQPVSRVSWLAGRVCVVLFTLLCTSIAIGLTGYASTHAQGLSISFSTMMLAGINTAPASIFLLGVSILTFGIVPRLTSFVSYGVMALSFLIEFLAAALNVPNWLLNLSVLRHVALAPGVSPDWHANTVLTLLGLLAALIGILAFAKRDIVTE